MDNKITDGGEKGKNPAMEFLIKSGSQESREILYFNFKDFSLHPEGNFGFKILYNGSGSDTITEGNLVTLMPKGENFQMTLYKNKKQVDSQVVSIGQEYQSPWMGIKLKIKEKKNLTQNILEVEGASVVNYESVPIPGIELESNQGEIFWLSTLQPLQLPNSMSLSLNQEKKILPFNLESSLIGLKFPYLISIKNKTFLVLHDYFYFFRVIILFLLGLIIFGRSLKNIRLEL